MIIREIIKIEYGLTTSFNIYYPIHNNHILKVFQLLDDFILKLNSVDKLHSYMFFNLLHKHLILAYLSVTRKHQSQFAWNMRVVLEAGVQSAYCLANKVDNIDELISSNFEETNKRFNKKCFVWLSDNYPDHNNIIKSNKEIMNQLGTHGGFVTAQNSINIKPEEMTDNIEGLFFDNPNDEAIKLDILTIGNICLGFLDLYYEINNKYKTFTIDSEYTSKRIPVGIENEKLRKETMNSSYWKGILNKEPLK